MDNAMDPVLALVLEPAGDEPVYVRIRDHVACLIHEGRLAAGSRLPPVRKLARALSIDPMTAARAYRQLAEAGLVEGRGGGGTIVLERGAPLEADAGAPLPASETVSATSLSARLFDLARAPGVISFTANYPDVAHSDVSSFRRCLADLVDDPACDRYFRYEPPSGRDFLREAISRMLAEEGMNASPANIVVTSGGQQALDLALRTLVEPGDRVIVERPAYFGLLNVLRAARAEIVEIDTGPRGPDVDELEALVRRVAPTAVCLNPTFQNPTGGTIDLERRRAVLALLRRTGVALVEDDPYPGMRFRGDPAPAFKAMADPDEPIFYCRGFGKMYLPGTRLGFAVVPGPSIARFSALKATTDLQSNGLLQGALARWLDGTTRHALAVEATRFYAHRQRRIVERLAAILPPGAQFDPPDGGLNLWIELPPGVAATDMYFRAARHGVAFAAGDAFFADKPNRRTLRLSFGRIDEDRIDEGLDRFVQVVEDLCRAAERPAAWFV